MIGACLAMGLIALSSHMILAVEVSGAQEYAAEIQRFLSEEGVVPGRFKQSFSTDALSNRLMLRLPGFSYVGMRYAGSVLVIDCRRVRDGEQMIKQGNGYDLIATRDGIITKLVVQSGTPLVSIGDAVYAGQVLIKGEERTQKGGTIPMTAQGQVYARVWANGEARVSLQRTVAKETGRIRTAVTLHTPWSSKVLQDAQPFEQQEVSVRTETIIDLFIPLWRTTRMYHEIELITEPRKQTDAASQAQGAAEKLAKKQLPAGVLILDKWVDYSMIDNEFVYASVVFEYEQDIAARARGE